MFRSPTTIGLSAVAAVFVLGTARPAQPAPAEAFPLEDYVPADFHRRYLALEPRVDWNASSGQDGFREKNSRSAFDGTHAALRLTYGSERFSQGLSWKLGNGGDLNRSGSDHSTRFHTRDAVSLSRSGSEIGSSRFDYNLFSRMSAQWYAADRFFLSPSAEADVHHTPYSADDGRTWDIFRAFPEDDVDFTGSRFRFKITTIDLRLRARMAFGYGRIQDVRFAETALFLLDRLSGTLGRSITFDTRTMRELDARLEAKRKLRPFFDARMAAIYDMESVLEFLKERRPDDTISSRAILEMADEWNFSGRHARQSGWEIRVFPFFEGTWNEDESRRRRKSYSITVPDGGQVDADALDRTALAAAGPDTSVTLRSYNGSTLLGGGMSAAYMRPWRRFYQFEASASSRLTRVEMEHGSNRPSWYGGGLPAGMYYVNFAYPMLDLGFATAVSWYPNSRTTLRAYLEGAWKRKWDYLGDKADLPKVDLRPPIQRYVAYSQTFGVKADYFLDPRLVLKAGIDARSFLSTARSELTQPPWENGGPETFKRNFYPRWSANAGLVYYLF